MYIVVDIAGAPPLDGALFTMMESTAGSLEGTPRSFRQIAGDSFGSAAAERDTCFAVVSVASEDDDDDEVQSRLKGPLETMDALECSLPVRLGKSNFYSPKDTSKSENGHNRKNKKYARKRNNLNAFSSTLEIDNTMDSSFGCTTKRLARCTLNTSSLACSPTISGSDSTMSSPQNSPPPLPYNSDSASHAIPLHWGRPPSHSQ